MAASIGWVEGQTPLIRTPAGLFVHAFMHNQFAALIGIDTNEKVTQVMISDDWFDLATDPYEPYIVVQWSVWIQGLVKGIARNIGKGEYEVNVEIFHVIAGQKRSMATRRLKVDEYELSTWVSIAGLTPADECDQIDRIVLELRVREVDPWNPDDRYDGLSLNYLLDCSAIQTQASQPIYGGLVAGAISAQEGSDFHEIGGIAHGTIPLEQDGDFKGHLAWSAKVAMTAR